MDLTKLDELGHTISRTVRHSTGLPVSLGIAPTKTLAKIASKLCKKYPKLDGACYMRRPEDIEKVLRKTPVGDVWGIGGEYKELLLRQGVKTAYDFTQLPPGWVRKRMTVEGLRTWKELRGEPCIEIVVQNPKKKQICNSCSFPKRSVRPGGTAYRRGDVHHDRGRKAAQTEKRLRGVGRFHSHELF